MRFIYDSVMAGERSQHWLDEQAVLLVDDILHAENAAFERTLRLPAIKASTRAELSRRLRLAADYIESHYERPLPLEALAKVAGMSSFQFVRYFALLHGATPHAYVVSCRAAAARRMVGEGVTNHQLIAERSGFGSRSSLYRALADGSSAEPAIAASPRRPSARRQARPVTIQLHHPHQRSRPCWRTFEGSDSSTSGGYAALPKPAEIDDPPENIACWLRKKSFSASATRRTRAVSRAASW